MTKFSQFFNPTPEPVNRVNTGNAQGVGEKMIGTYGCSSCEESVEEAWYNEDMGVVSWTCPSGHTTVRIL